MNRKKSLSESVIPVDVIGVCPPESYSDQRTIKTNALLNHESENSSDKWLSQGVVSQPQQKWKNIAIISRNSIAIDGIRAIYRSLCPLRVQIFNDTRMLHSTVLIEKSFIPDVVIWIDSRSESLKNMAALIIQLNRKLPALQQLIITECIPSDFSFLPRGVRIVSLSAPVVEIKKLMLSSLASPDKAVNLFPKRFMTPGQWRIIKLLVKGLSAKEIAKAISISPKTVWGREEEVMRSLNIDSHVHKAWFYRSVDEVLKMIPGLRKICRSGIAGD
ncbi:LuxR C-terminal-related transcriptional regulator [uncultured Pluralibacter sp.]|uniref:helix-turn-helix transcriptional regulator n=1 Tax=uncultured Pluralibacter sp. TaxID=1490864 RepID=UPI00260CA657|nr:LuxR C-terminal-related transcriptional regulator [uncultured Pluralibacter sp.]